MHKENRATGKKFGIMIQIQEPKSLWEIVHMDWVTALPPGGDRSFNTCLVLVDRHNKSPMFLPFHKDYTAMETAIIIWNSFINHPGLFQNIISDRDPKLTEAYGKISITYLAQIHHYQQHITLKLMDYQKE
ncbi:hypothetical protein O181_107168 [Austropuccinia psidii MF-1]|uniref:Integrase catalytic domain-containing protein n=1 Tax=Austropuccinia psidii MF-1 TaxID=1389203 RepID=A0A9Q3PML5_9BASI|nr:hypothetical protein [Austropuccinia psidii MF-1]